MGVSAAQERRSAVGHRCAPRAAGGPWRVRVRGCRVPRARRPGPGTRDAMQSAETEASGRAFMAFLTGVATAAAANGAVSVLMHPLHVDVGFLLDAAQRVLDRGRLYRDH